MKNIKAVIWDMGGVFIRNFNPAPRRELEIQYHLEPGSIDHLVFNSPASRQASIGLITVKEMWLQILAEIHIPKEELQNVTDLFWAGDGADVELLDFIRGLRPAYRTGLISNAWIDARGILTNKYHCMDAFDHAIFSAEIRIMKPDPRIYQSLLGKMGIMPEESIFIDDFAENVEAAQSLGMTAIHFKISEQAIHEVKTFLMKDRT